MVIAVTNAKGGTGKSTTAGIVAAGLHRRGKKVLLIDADPQGNATSGAGVQSTAYGLADVLTGKRKASEVIVSSPAGYDVISASGALAAVELSGLNEDALTVALRPITKRYDFIIIDTPPHMGAITAAVITAAHKLIIPTQAEAYATAGLLQFMQLLAAAGASSKTLGILVTLFQRRRIHSETVEAIRGIFGDRVFKTVIRANTAIAEAQALKTSLFDYAPGSNGAEDYNALIDEVIERVG